MIKQPDRLRARQQKPVQTAEARLSERRELLLELPQVEPRVWEERVAWEAQASPA